MPEAEITNADEFLESISRLREDFMRGGKLSLVWRCENSMTPTQRGSLHLWCEMMAKVLNDAGYDQTVWFREHARSGIRVPWSKESVKSVFYKPVLESQSGKTSTEDMSTLEPSEICKIVGAALADRLGVTPPPWPTRFGDG